MLYPQNRDRNRICDVTHPMYWSVPGIKLTQALLELPEVNTALQYAKININKIKRKQRRNGFR